jgi:hypothetical protein
MTRGEILDGPERRRRWSEDEKAAILAELAKPGSKGAEVARRYGVSRGLLVSVVWLTPLTAWESIARGRVRRSARLSDRHSRSPRRRLSHQPHR